MNVALENLLLQERYQVGPQINEGQYGTIFDVEDLKEKSESDRLVIKISQFSEDAAREIKLFIKI